MSESAVFSVRHVLDTACIPEYSAFATRLNSPVHCIVLHLLVDVVRQKKRAYNFQGFSYPLELHLARLDMYRERCVVVFPSMAYRLTEH